MKTRNEKTNWEVPWIHAEEWREMVNTVRAVCRGLGDKRSGIMGLVREIGALYEELEIPLNHLCMENCPTCTEVCCLRATVWYDRRDLLIYFLAFDAFPECQVSRSDAGVCCHLGKGGCRLPRPERPFICTWYICASQLETLKRDGGSPLMLQDKLRRIKELRRKVAALCQPA